MTRCTNCYGKWNPLQVWALFFERDGKECPYCLKTQYLSADTLQYFNGIDLRGYFMWMLPVLATLSDKDETCNLLFKDKTNPK